MKFSSALLMAVSFIFIASYVSGDSKKQVTAVVSDGVSRFNFIPHPGARFIPHFFCVRL